MTHAHRGRPLTAEHRASLKKAWKKRKPRFQRTCVRCGREFMAHVPHAKYCNGRDGLCTTKAEREELLRKQNGVCAICGSASANRSLQSGLSLDHSHATGKIRGLLCHRCNTAIGLLQDDPEIVRKAAHYLESFDV